MILLVEALLFMMKGLVARLATASRAGIYGTWCLIQKHCIYRFQPLKSMRTTLFGPIPSCKKFHRLFREERKGKLKILHCVNTESRSRLDMKDWQVEEHKNGSKMQKREDYHSSR